MANAEKEICILIDYLYPASFKQSEAFDPSQIYCGFQIQDDGSLSFFLLDQPAS